MQRNHLSHPGLQLSFLDSGGTGPVLIALHAHWMEASTFDGVAQALAPAWRVVALDQRGHGYSDHAKTYTRADYLGDLDALVRHLRIGEPFVLLGNSLGGINAIQYAAKFPSKVRGLIIEDIGVSQTTDLEFVRAWQGTFKTKAELEEKIGPRLVKYLEPSFRHTDQGWTLAFNPLDMIESQNQMKGNYWSEWLATSCPALVIRGSESRVTTEAELSDMAKRRPDTEFVQLHGGHSIHLDAPDDFVAKLKSFLASLPGN